jgi:photosystem II stability/assembly factor-like uncharacterized protein
MEPNSRWTRWPTTAVLLAALSCSPELSIPPDAIIDCDATSSCPGDWRCIVPPGRCVPSQSDDTEPPILTAFQVSPERVARGARITIQLSVDEPLLTDPVVRIADRWDAVRTQADDDDPSSFVFSHVVGDDAEEGRATLDVVLIDRFGNQAERRGGEVYFDFTPPRVEPLAWVASESRTAVTHGDVLGFRGRAEAGSTLVSATVVDPLGATLASAEASLSESDDPDWSDLEGLMDLSGVDLAGVDAVAVDVVLEDEAGNRTPPGTVRTPVLGVRLEPPADPYVSIIGKPSTAVREVQVLLAAVGATEVYLDGDLADAPTVRSWTPLVSPFPVLLTPENGPKVVSAVFRDAAHQVAGPVQDQIELAVGVVSSHPRLVPPDGQTAVKAGDRLAVAGQGQAGAEVVSARLLDPADGAEIMSLPDGALTFSEGLFSGGVEVTGPWVTHGRDLVLEVILELGELRSVASASRSPPVRIDLQPPDAPPAPRFRLVEAHPAPYDASALEPEPLTYRLHGTSGALVGSRWADVYDDPTLENHVARIHALENADFLPVDLPASADRRYFLVAVDGAGNESAPTELRLPEVLIQAIEPTDHVRSVGEVQVVVVSDRPLQEPPRVTVGPASCDAPETASEATFLSGSPGEPGSELRYRYRPQGAGCEGDRASVVRVKAEPSHLLLAAGSEATTGAWLTHDFTPPVLDESALVVTQAPPGESDLIAGAPGAVSDRAGDDVLDLVRSPVAVEVRSEAGLRIGGLLTAADDGSFPAVDLGDNLHETVSIRLIDTAGNVTTVVLPGINDIRPPVIDGLVADPYLRSDGGPVTIGFTAADAETGLDAVSVYVHGRAASLVSGNPGADPGVTEPFVFTYTPVPGIDDEGIAVVFVEVTDRVGNVGSAATEVFFDLTPPEVSIVHPGDRPEWSPGARVEGFASDALTGVAAVQVAVSSTATGLFWDGEAFDADAPAWHLAEGTTGWSWLDSAVDYGAGGAFRFHVRALDGAGNASEPVVADVSVDPDLPLPPAGTGAHALGEARVRLTWDAPTDPSITCIHVHYALEAGPPYDGTGADQGDSPIALCAGETTLDVTGLPRGRYVWTLTAVDDTGAESPYGPQHAAASQGWRLMGTTLGGQTIRDVTSLGDGRFVAVGHSGIVLTSDDDGQSWSADRVTEGDLRRVYGSGDVVVALGVDGILRSEDGGLSWERPAQPDELLPLDVWGEGDRFVAVGRMGSAVSGSPATVRSVDGGQSWTLVDSAGSDVLDRVWGAGDLVVAGWSGLHQLRWSADGGESWQWDSQLEAVASLHGDGESVYMVRYSGAWIARLDRLLLSDEGALERTQIPNPPTITDLAHVRHGRDALYVTANDRFYALPHGSSSWQSQTYSDASLSLLWAGDGYAVAASPFRADMARHDGGAFSAVDNPLDNRLSSLAGAGDVVVATAEHGGLMRSDSRGATFSIVHPLYPFRVISQVWSLGAEVLMTSSWSSGRLLRSVDYGRTWTELDLPSGFHDPLLIWGDGDHRLVTGRAAWPATNEARLLVSEDGGRSFELRAPDAQRFLALWGSGSTVIATSLDGAIHRSLDGGWNWTRVSEPPDPAISLTRLAVTGAHAVAVGSGGAGRRSTDGGESWEPFDSPLGTVRALWAGGEGRFVGVGSNGVFLSLDGGASWEQTLASASNASLAEHQGTLWLLDGISSHRIRRSDDGGETWIEAHSWSPGAPGAIDAKDDLLIVATSEGLRISIDRGETLAPIGPVDPFWPGTVSGLHLMEDGSVLGLGAPTVIHLRD